MTTTYSASAEKVAVLAGKSISFAMIGGGGGGGSSGGNAESAVAVTAGLGWAWSEAKWRSQGGLMGGRGVCVTYAFTRPRTFSDALDYTAVRRLSAHCGSAIATWAPPPTLWARSPWAGEATCGFNSRCDVWGCPWPLAARRRRRRVQTQPGLLSTCLPPMPIAPRMHPRRARSISCVLRPPPVADAVTRIRSDQK